MKPFGVSEDGIASGSYHLQAPNLQNPRADINPLSPEIWQQLLG